MSVLRNKKKYYTIDLKTLSEVRYIYQIITGVLVAQ